MFALHNLPSPPQSSEAAAIPYTTPLAELCMKLVNERAPVYTHGYNPDEALEHLAGTLIDGSYLADVNVARGLIFLLEHTLHEKKALEKKHQKVLENEENILTVFEAQTEAYAKLEGEKAALVELVDVQNTIIEHQVKKEAALERAKDTLLLFTDYLGEKSLDQQDREEEVRKTTQAGSEGASASTSSESFEQVLDAVIDDDRKEKSTKIETDDGDTTGNGRVVGQPPKLSDEDNHLLQSAGIKVDRFQDVIELSAWESDRLALLPQLDRIVRYRMDVLQFFACGLEAELDARGARIDSLGAQVVNMTAQLQEKEKTITSQMGRILSMEKDMAEQEDDLTHWKKSLQFWLKGYEEDKEFWKATHNLECTRSTSSLSDSGIGLSDDDTST